MRFAWLHKSTTNNLPAKPGCGISLSRMVYNAVWWIPILLALAGTITYGAGFIGFAIVTTLRLVANLVVNNVLTVEQAGTFPFRA